jgi:endonuclease-3 related protein
MTAITRDHGDVGDLPIARSQDVIRYYSALYSRWGPQNWWPAQSRLEVIAGAYLTQNTNWSNVEKAIANLRRARVLNVKGLREVPLRRLERLVRPSGYFRQKAWRLKNFIRYLDKNYQGSLNKMFARPTGRLRAELLALNGVGPETADSILLYAGNHPIFVVDAYTRRILERHGIIAPKSAYEQIRAQMEQAIGSADAKPLAAAKPGREPRHPVSRMSRTPRSELVRHYNEMHALIVRAGNEHCRSTPRCEACPLREFLPASPGANDIHK